MSAFIRAFRVAGMIGTMRDWEQFLVGVPWFLRPGEQVIVEAAAHWSRGRIEGLPRLSALLSSAIVTRVAIDRQTYDLLAWGPRERRRGWLCLPPPDSPVPEVKPLHQAFLAASGGIVERFGNLARGGTIRTRFSLSPRQACPSLR
jgi:hypothetical protein